MGSLRAVTFFQEDRTRCILRLLTAALFGALVGALLAKLLLLQAPGWMHLPFEAERYTDPARAYLMALCFPALLAAVGLSGLRWAYPLLFFAKGLLVSAVLCVLSGTGQLSLPLIKAICFRTALPLVIHFFTAAQLISTPHPLCGPVGRILIPLNLSAAIPTVLLDLLL